MTPPKERQTIKDSRGSSTTATSSDRAADDQPRKDEPDKAIEPGIDLWLAGADPSEADADDPSAQSDEPSTEADRDRAPLADPGRRFVGFALEIVLIIGTLGVGWLIWSALEWRYARTPAKRLLRDLQVVDAWSGEPADWKRMAWRELGAKIGLVGLFGAATFGLGWAIAAALVLTSTRAALWDRIAGTTVIKS